MRGPVIAVLAGVLAGCAAQSRGAPQMWFASHNATLPTRTHAIVCHGFGCQLRTSVGLTADDLATFEAFFRDGAASPEAERAAIARAISWAEKRVAREVGSENDVGGLDLRNSGKRGQMDCIDEAANTTSYLLIAEKRGLLRHHTVAQPVARGFFLDGRYPHATAVVREKATGTAYAVDSWPHPNGVAPDILKLDAWFAASPARG